MIRPENLVPGDTIALIAPAKAIEPDLVDTAVVLLETAGYKVLVGKHTKGQHHYFSGTDDERAADLQWAIDHPAVKQLFVPVADMELFACWTGCNGLIFCANQNGYSVFQI
jgi:muramoyltetrapeptide carboxypeptidase